jgi:uncharacterized protein
LPTSAGASCNIKKIAIFLALTFGCDWTLAICYFASGRTMDDQLFVWVGVLYMSVPAIMSVVVQKFMFKEPLVEPLAINFRVNRWFGVAWILPFVMVFLTVFLDLLFPGVRYNFQPQLLANQTLKLITFATAINSVAAFGEELGFRGLLWRELMPLGFWRASAIIGVIWGIWHAPLVLNGLDFPQHPRLGFLLFIINSVFLSNICSYIRLKSKSVIAVSILHGALNSTTALFTIGVIGGSDLLTDGCGLTATIIYVLASILIAVLLKREGATKRDVQ